MSHQFFTQRNGLQSSCFRQRVPKLNTRLIPLRAKKIRLEEVLTDKQRNIANLRSEAETPFRSLRMIFYGVGVISATISFVICLPQLAAGLTDAPNALAVDGIVRNIGIDVGIAGACAFLFNQDYKSYQRQLVRLGREETLAALGIELASGKRLSIGDLRGFSRVVICIATSAQLQAAWEGGEALKEELIQRGVLFIPVPIDGAEASPLPPLTAEDVRWRANPVRPDDWRRWFDQQLNIAGKATSEKGLYLGLRLDGRVRASGMGLPPWQRFVQELAPMEGSGAWTGFMDGFDGEVKVFNG